VRLDIIGIWLVAGAFAGYLLYLWHLGIVIR
jgi:hypothetical protein